MMKPGTALGLGAAVGLWLGVGIGVVFGPEYAAALAVGVSLAAAYELRRERGRPGEG